ncbi:MAG: hypothetical protein NTV49_03040 [Kiritimatiellaeota bacterium]|nr:hypothetical protein [Kiritimatiellota bacterium]
MIRIIALTSGALLWAATLSSMATTPSVSIGTSFTLITPGHEAVVFPGSAWTNSGTFTATPADSPTNHGEWKILGPEYTWTISPDSSDLTFDPRTNATVNLDLLNSNAWGCVYTITNIVTWSESNIVTHYVQSVLPLTNGTATNSMLLDALKVKLKNPIDTDGDGKINDFAGDTSNRTGNTFNYDRSLTNLCTIPCRVKIDPDTAELRTQFKGKVTATLTAITDAGFTSILTWDHSVSGDPASGSLVYNSTSAVWEATATFTGLPSAPSNSWGRVPKGLHDLLYGDRIVTITVQNPSGSGTFCTNATNYEVYFGDSLVIGGVKMAETTVNYANHIASLISGTALKREIFDKMNCSTETFSFTGDSNASNNFVMRCKAVEIMDGMDNGSIDVSYRDPYSRCGDTMVTITTNNSVVTTNWVFGTYWLPKYTNSPYSRTFLQKSGTAAHNAINNVTPFRGECAGAIEICIFTAADFAIGESEFNSLHPAGSLGLADFGSDFVTHMGTMNDTNTLVPGDYIYMNNKNDYREKATNKPAIWTGENCVYMGLHGGDVGTFGGLGDNMSFLTESEMRDVLQAGYEHDCPTIVEDPLVQIRFTIRKRMQTGN